MSSELANLLGASEIFSELMEDGLIRADGTPDTKNSTNKDELVKRVAFYLYDFARSAYNPNIYYARRRGTQVYRVFNKDDNKISDLVVSLYQKLFKKTPYREVQATVRNIEQNILTKVVPDTRYIKIFDVFFDTLTGEILTDLPDGEKCYYVLFDNDDKPEYNPERFMSRLKDKYDETYELLKDRDKFDTSVLPMDIDFIRTWADASTPGFKDRYFDMLLAVVPNFMYKKPPIAYFLLGNARGGKSSYVRMLHYIFGENNTSNVRLNELSDPHKNLQLTNTILNAPDEEMEERLTSEDIANFKSLAAHEKIEFPVLFSQKPQVLIPNFMMYLPSNSMPDFSGGTSTEACMRRARVIMFPADLSKLDHIPEDFVRDVLTEQAVADMLGEVLALAWYFNKHEFWYSDTMIRSTEFVSESTNSADIFARRFREYFDGFESKQILWDEYQLWCDANEVQCEKRKVLNMRFIKEMTSRTTFYDPDTGEKEHIYRVPSGKWVLRDGLVIENKSVMMLHNAHISALIFLDKLNDDDLRMYGVREKRAEHVYEVLSEGDKQ